MMPCTRGKKEKKKKPKLINNNDFIINHNEEIIYSDGCRGTHGHDRL